MPRLRFVKDFDWQFHPRAVRHYRQGCSYLVSRECARMAIEARAAVEAGRNMEGDADAGVEQSS